MIHVFPAHLSEKESSLKFFDRSIDTKTKVTEPANRQHLGRPTT